MDDSDFIDLYEILEISPNANPDTIERMFRHFARRYHPDNRESGDRLHFDVVVAAHNTLKDPVKRAEYDIRHKEHSAIRSRFVEGASDSHGIGRDIEIQNKLLSILYARRRNNVRDPGVGDVELERAIDCPIEQLEFNLWFLKEKGWIKRSDNGMLAITVEGIEHANAEHQRKVTKKLLLEQRDES
jgi:curved DNA-binding protein CbpA